ncbi:MAG: hypothetical protein IPM42_05655 [Saprospiraceae bacterium]|nr:hypothetical protein [Saprospiraceae bacterium]
MLQSRLEKLQNMLIENPEDSFIRYALAKEYEQSGSLELALKEFLHLSAHDPDYVGMYYHLGHLYLKLDDTENALSTFEEGILVAKRLHDFHALSELNSAKLNLEMEM